jgi:hypothetical protein
MISALIYSIQTSTSHLYIQFLLLHTSSCRLHHPHDTPFIVWKRRVSFQPAPATSKPHTTNYIPPALSRTLWVEE